MTFHFKIGLKLHSSNTSLIAAALNLKKKGLFDYIELYTVPGSYEETIDAWKHLSIPFIIHAPHAYSGLNFSLPELKGRNEILINEVEHFRVALNSKFVIYHPGIQGSIRETIRQIKNNKRRLPEHFDTAIIENKPMIGIRGEICVGASPEEIRQITEETGLGFCFDVGHAIYYSAWAKTGYEEIMDQFISSDTQIYHLSDGDLNSQTDLHLNFGEGNFGLSRILQKIPATAYITIETNRNMNMNLTDFELDIIYLKKLLRE